MTRRDFRPTAREREGRGASSDARWVGQCVVVGSALRAEIVATEGASTARPTGRVSAVVRRQRARQDGPHEVSGGSATRTTIAVICIRPSPHTGQRERSTPVSRCSSTAADSGGASSGGGCPRRSPAPRQRASTRAIGEQAEVANAHEAARHDVEQKASQEFVGLERQDLHAVVVGVVLPAEPDAAVVVIDEPIIRERDAVGVPPEVVEHLLGAGEGPLRIHDPVDGPQVAEEGGEGAAIGQIGGARRRRSAGRRRTRAAGRRDTSRERPSTAPGRETGTTSDRRSTASDPRAKAPPVTRQCRWRCCERFCPHVWRIAVIADRAAEMARIASEGEQRVGGRAKEERVDHARIALRERVERVRQREDDVEVRNGQQVGLARREPPFLGERLALRAMAIATGVVGDPHGAAAVTRLPMPAEDGGAAGRDRPQRSRAGPSRGDACDDTRRHGRARCPPARAEDGRSRPPCPSGTAHTVSPAAAA